LMLKLLNSVTSCGCSTWRQRGGAREGALILIAGGRKRKRGYWDGDGAGWEEVGGCSPTLLLSWLRGEGGGTKQSCSMPAREAGDQSAAVDCSTSPSSVARILTPSSVNLLPLS
jgi:hypothetical protein